MMLEIQDTLVSLDLFTQRFCCDLERCKGQCCIEGDAGAPLSVEEIDEIENVLPVVWDDLSPESQAVIKKQGVAYTDASGELVTSIVGNKECVFTCIDADSRCQCVLDRAFREGKTRFQKPLSCHLYPVRLKQVGDATAVNYDRWDICHCALVLGRKQGIALYEYLREPLIRRFGEEWYEEVCTAARELKQAGYIQE